MKKRISGTRIAAWAAVLLALLTLAGIYSNSLKGAEASVKQSEEVLERFRTSAERVLHFFGLPVTQDSLSHFVRKTAHFAEYAILGALVLLSMLLFRLPKRSLYFLSLPLCAFCAAADEGIQSFAPGRSPELADVLIDVAGAAAGILLTAALYAFFHFIYKKYGKRKKTERPFY